jgi:hypothetical protein
MPVKPIVTPYCKNGHLRTLENTYGKHGQSCLECAEMQRYPTPTDPTKPIEIPLSQGKVALIDFADFDLICRHKWCAVHEPNDMYYAVMHTRSIDGKRTRIGMHVLIAGKGCDHKNRNGLDNRRENLRPASAVQNSSNRKIGKSNKSGYKGVSYCVKKRTWRASIMSEGIRHQLGSYHTAEDAALAYNEGAKRFHGEFAYLNEVPKSN